jgi:ferredoxin-like protein FixX
MKITEERFEKAKFLVKYNQEIIDEYHKQQKEEFERKRKEQEDACPEHEYEYTNAKWQSATQRRCMNCGKTID